MAQEVINLGLAPNDGTGDKLRTAFTKVNNNFAELYQTGGGGGGLQGTQGAQGLTGSQGTDGTQGETGTQGLTGSQGTDGTQGLTGSQGTDGTQGETGTQGINGTQGTVGTTGSTGTAGAPGADSIIYTFDSSTTDSNPSNGFARLNNSNRSLVTEAYVSKVSNSGANSVPWLNSLVASTNSPNKSTITFGRTNDFVYNYARYYVTGLTDAVGYVKLALTYIDHIGTLNTSGANLLLGASRIGDAGAQGATGGGASLPLANGTSNIDIAEANGDVTVTSNNNTWTFSTDGSLSVPGTIEADEITASNVFVESITLKANTLLAGDESKILSVANSSGDGQGYTTLRLIPDDTIESFDQYLIIDPTNPNHIHIRAGGDIDNSGAALILGGEISNFAVYSGENPVVAITANNYSFTFGDFGYPTMLFPAVLFDDLPQAPGLLSGLRAFIYDANIAAPGNFGAVVSGGGGNFVPVWSDGSNWRIG